MATRIRLQRHGKKGNAFYHIVAADSRAKRDGKFIEKLGTYDPNKNPAIININFDRTLYWVQVGAELTDTARAILSYKGILYKNHLIKGVAKGALTEAQVEEKFNKWLAEKEAKITGKVDSLAKTKETKKAAALKAEVASNEAKAKAIEAKNNPVVEETPVEEVVAEVATEETVAEVAVAVEETVTEVAAEETATEATAEETPAAEDTTETPAE